MRLRRRYNLPELLTLLSCGEGHPGAGTWGFARQPGLAKLRQVIHLTREGLREYNQRLDHLERDVAHDSYASGRDYGRHDDDRQQVDDEVIEADVSEHVCLTRHEIHHLFEKLAIQRRSLNARGYPFTSDVDEERARIYPESECLEGRDVEAAWDDWRNENGRSLFRAHRREPDKAHHDEHHDGFHSPIARQELEVLSRVLREAVERAFEGFDRSRDHREHFSRNGHSREPSPSLDTERVFRIFDEMLLSAERAARFTTDNLPRLSEVNDRLLERGESALDDEAALRREWMTYLVTSAFAREEQVRRRRPNGGADVIREDPVVDVEIGATVIERESGAGKGRKRKPV